MEPNYKELYEKEHEKCADLADRIVALENDIIELQFKLDKIKNNALWKLTKPARNVFHFVVRIKQKLAGCGGPKDILRKLKNKKKQMAVMASYGTESFPDTEQRKLEETAEFPFGNVGFCHESDLCKLGTLFGRWFRRRTCLCGRNL